MSDTFVYIGPSLPADEVHELLPKALVRPPVRHGDLLALDPAAGDRVLIVDGLFLHAAPVRHREILHLLDRGVVVAGAGSMGALRAAELWPFGMRGFGAVFGLYRDGVVTGDDEVAIVHGCAEDGHRALSEPLVNIRIALRGATEAGAIRASEATELLELARELPFRLRGYRCLAAVARQRLSPAAVDRFLDWAGAHAVDTKAADARLLLRLAARNDPELRPAGPDDQPIVNLRTHHLRSWRARFGSCTPDRSPSPNRSPGPAPGPGPGPGPGSTVTFSRASSFDPSLDTGTGRVTRAQVVAAVMLTHPAFATEHRRQVFAELVGAHPDDSTVEQQALALARERGLSGGVHPGQSWLLAAEAGLPEPERLGRILYRAFGTGEYRRLSPSRLPTTLDTEPVLAAARDLVLTAEQLNRQLPATDRHRPGARLRFRTEVIERVFTQLWGVDRAEFPAAVWDRGFAHLEAFWIAAEPLVSYLKVVGPPDLPGPDRSAPVPADRC